MELSFLQPAMDAFLLAGGSSRRMGQNKALLEAGGASLIRHVADAVGTVAERVVVIAGEPDHYSFLGLPVIEDAVRGIGPLGGIYTALRAAGSNACLVLACDLPLVRPALLLRLQSELQDFDAVVPRTEHADHPLCAVYAKSCFSRIETQIRGGNYKVLTFLARVRTRWVGPDIWRSLDPQGLSFVNVNTPEALKRVGEFMAGRRPSPFV